MAGSPTKYNQVQMVQPMIASSSADWLVNDVVIPANTYARDTTLGRVKLGNGVHKFSELPWSIEASLPQAYRTLLDKMFETADGGVTYTLKLGQNIPESMVLSDATGKIRHDQLPNFILNTVKIVNTYGDLQALGAEFHSTLVLVIDATNGTITGGGDATAGDATVEAGAALYIWFDPDGTGVLPDSWQKVSELGSLDINWQLMLSDHFKYRGDNANTLDDIIDGAVYGKMTKAEITRLSTVETNADVTDTANVQAANAIMYNHPLMGQQMTAADLAAFLALGPNV